MNENSVKIEDMSPHRMLEIINELKAIGLRVNKDFTFSYTPSGSWTFDGGASKKFVMFFFNDKKHLTYFLLKYT